jgi:hypothetical protein
MLHLLLIQSIQSSMHPFVTSNHWSVPSIPFIHQPIHSFNQSSIHHWTSFHWLSIHSIIYSTIHQIINTFIHQPIHSFNQSSIHHYTNLIIDTYIILFTSTEPQAVLVLGLHYTTSIKDDCANNDPKSFEVLSDTFNHQTKKPLILNLISNLFIKPICHNGREPY